MRFLSLFSLAGVPCSLLQRFLLNFTRVGLFALLLTGFFLGYLLRTDATGIEDAISYLKNKTPNPWITMAFVAVGEETDISYLKNVPTESALNLEAPLLAIIAAGQDPRTFAQEDLVEKLKSFFDGTQIGDPNALNDDMFGILALVGTGLAPEDPVIQGAKKFLLQNQNSDGGWSFATGGTSDTNMTAMAMTSLLAVGFQNSESVIQNAVAYLKNAQNNDGGFPYDPKSPFGVASDGASSSWIVFAINKLGEDPRSWTKEGLSSQSSVKEGKNPIGFLSSLQVPGGYFEYQKGTGEDSFTPLTTAYAVIALSGKSLPISMNSSSKPPISQVSFRIEGSSAFVCKGKVETLTALDVVKNAAEDCAYTYEIKDMSFGPYLVRIGNDEAKGEIGWLYRVNLVLADKGAADFQLSGGEEVLWYYGDWRWEPLRIRFTKDQELYVKGETITGVTEAFQGGQWAAVGGVEVQMDGDTYPSNENGLFTISLGKPGIFELRAQKEGFIRSDTFAITIGDTLQEIGLSTEVTEEGAGGEGQKPEVGFSVSRLNIAFGQLQPGKNALEKVNLVNQGQKSLHTRAKVKGDEIFYFLKIEEVMWNLFETALPKGATKEVNVSLSIPLEFQSFGKKEGKLIFWGVAQE